MPAGLIPKRALTWADGDNILFAVHENKADAVWTIAVDGKHPAKVIELPGRVVSTIKMSPGSKRLGIVTAHPISDVVLINEVN